jgi:predicted NAD/FAD-binding protein
VRVAPWSPTAMKIVWDLLRFRWRARTQLAAGELTGISFGEYLDTQYCKEFGERFAVPVLCVVCTCSPAAVRAYPADTLVEYWLCWALRGEGLQRAEGGTKSVVAHLSAGLSQCHLGTRVTALRDGSGSGGGSGKRKWLVRDDKGAEREFDHVILATQAKHAASLIEDYCNASSSADSESTEKMRSLAAAVAGVTSEAGEMVLHGDGAAMPDARSSWSAMNVFVSPDRSAVMCTAWQSKIEARGREKDFQHPLTTQQQQKKNTSEQQTQKDPLPLLQVTPHTAVFHAEVCCDSCRRYYIIRLVWSGLVSS